MAVLPNSQLSISAQDGCNFTDFWHARIFAYNRARAAGPRICGRGFGLSKLVGKVHTGLHVSDPCLESLGGCSPQEIIAKLMLWDVFPCILGPSRALCRGQKLYLSHNLQCTCLHNLLKAGSRYDAGTSVTSVALWAWASLAPPCFACVRKRTTILWYN